MNPRRSKHDASILIPEVSVETFWTHLPKTGTTSDLFSVSSLFQNKRINLALSRDQRHSHLCRSDVKQDVGK